jgi:hypothetical protein
VRSPGHERRYFLCFLFAAGRWNPAQVIGEPPDELRATRRRAHGYHGVIWTEATKRWPIADAVNAGLFPLRDMTLSEFNAFVILWAGDTAITYVRHAERQPVVRYLQRCAERFTSSPDRHLSRTGPAMPQRRVRTCGWPGKPGAACAAAFSVA